MSDDAEIDLIAKAILAGFHEFDRRADKRFRDGVVLSAYGKLAPIAARAAMSAIKDKTETDRDTLAARVKALEAALEPFARIDLLHDDGWDDTDDIELMFGDYATLCRVTVADLRRARALLAQLEGG